MMRRSSTLDTWCEQLTHWKRSWCWEKLKVEGEEDTEDEMVGWHHWFNGHELGANSGRWWGTGKTGMLQSMGWQRVRHGLNNNKKEKPCGCAVRIKSDHPHNGPRGSLVFPPPGCPMLPLPSGPPRLGHWRPADTWENQGFGPRLAWPHSSLLLGHPGPIPQASYRQHTHTPPTSQDLPFGLPSSTRKTAHQLPSDLTKAPGQLKWLGMLQLACCIISF